MADISPTNTSPGIPAGAQKTANENIAQWDVCYAVSGTESAIADVATEAKTDVDGIALRAATSGNIVYLATTGDSIDTGISLTTGLTYYLSDTGGIMPESDLTTGDWVVRVGIGSTTAQYLDVDIKNYARQYG